MPKKIQKTLQDYLSKIKTHHPRRIQLPFNSLSSSKSWVLSGCKHPKTPSFALEDGRNVVNGETHGGSSSNNSNSNKNQTHKDDAAATLADVDRFLLENFKSLYLRDDEGENKNTKRVLEKNHDDDEAPKSGPVLFDSPLHLCAPKNRFLAKKGFSGSLVEDAMTTCDDDNEANSSSNSTTTTATLHDSSLMNPKDKALPENCIALLSYSPSPYEDFRRSMQDMVEARSSDIDWEFMEELLFCYLNLNEKKSHKFILSAFVDLITVMRSRNSELALAKPRSVRTVRIDAEGKKKKKKIKKKIKGVTLEFESSS